MSSIKAVVKKDLKDTLRSRAVYVSLGTAVLLLVIWSGDLRDMAGVLRRGAFRLTRQPLLSNR